MKTPQASKDFQAVVQQLQRDNPQASYHDCYMRAKNFVAPRLYEAAVTAVNEYTDLEITPDGEHLIKGYPPTPEVCMAMQIPIKCTKQVYAIAKLAEQAKPTPEIAACVIMGISRFCQTENGVGFSEIFASIKKHNPKLFAQLRKVS